MDDPRKDPDYDPAFRQYKFTCDHCGYPIYGGDTYYLINRMFLCPSCKDEYITYLVSDGEREA